MRMMSLAAPAAAPTFNGVESFDVTVGTGPDAQTFHVEVPIAAARLQTGTPITVGEAPGAMTVNGDNLYVVNQNPVTDPVTGEQTYTVSVIDTTTNQVIDTIPVGTGPDRDHRQRRSRLRRQ